MHELSKAELLPHATITDTDHPHLLIPQAGVILAWQPVEDIWSDPQVLAYLDGPAPTHARDEGQPGVHRTLEKTYHALTLFGRALREEQERRSAFPALVESKVVLLLPRIAHWLQQTPCAAVLDFSTQKWVGALLWHIATELLWGILGPDDFEKCAYPQLCAQLLISGEPP